MKRRSSMTKNWIAVFCFSLLFLLIVATQTMATKIEYTPTDNGGGNYTLNFAVTNDTLSEDIQWLSIFFGETTNGLNFTNTNKFSDFQPDFWGVNQPAGWLSYSFEPSAIDKPGLFNSDIHDSDAASIAPGHSLSGFSVTFDMAAGASYDHLWFDIGKFEPAPVSFDIDGYPLGNYTKLGNGYTQPLGGTAPVPEPATLVFLLLGLATFGLAKKKNSERD